MNLVSETKERLSYQIANLEDLQECMKNPVTKDCLHFIKNQIKKSKYSIEYYSELLKVLERNEDL